MFLLEVELILKYFRVNIQCSSEAIFFSVTPANSPFRSDSGWAAHFGLYLLYILYSYTLQLSNFQDCSANLIYANPVEEQL
jgi:hypothetical protein